MYWGFDWTYLVLIPGLLFALWAQAKVKSNFARYGKVPTRAGRTAAEAARILLDRNGLRNVGIERVRGHLTDHYDPRDKMLYLSDSVYGSTGIAAIGVACHEAGHAIQDAEDYGPLKLRIAMVPVTNIGSRMAFPIFLIGLIVSIIATTETTYELGGMITAVGIFAFSLSALFQAITLPVEFNASDRALRGMQEACLLTENEIPGAKKVLKAAALTYVAALASSLLSVLRLILIANNARRR